MSINHEMPQLMELMMDYEMSEELKLKAYKNANRIHYR
jgi:hypothetical protein